jgi:hypothetical protein
LSELALDGVSQSNLDQFQMNRPILQQNNPVKSFMV